MKFNIRKVESVTLQLASSPIELDTEDFKNLGDYSYTGFNEIDFINYINNLILNGLPPDLNEELSELVMSLEDPEMREYANSADSGSNAHIEIGYLDPEYRRAGGFKSLYSVR